MGPEPTREIISAGSGRDPAEPWTARSWLWLRARPGLLAVLVAAAAVTSTVAGVILLPTVTARARGPQILVDAGNDGSPLVAFPWTARSDGRPDGPPVLSVGTRLRHDAVPDSWSASRETVTLLGITGDGVVRRDNPPVPLPARSRPVATGFRAVLDCAEIAAAAPPAPYRLRIRSTGAVGTRESTISAGQEGRRWSDAAWLACASWTARQDLTITAATARVHPRELLVTLTLTVTNAGRRESTLVPAGRDLSGRTDLTVTGALPLRVPPRSTRTVVLALALHRCDLVTSPPEDGLLGDIGPGGSWLGDPRGTSAMIGLLAISGSPRTLDAVSARLPVPSFGAALGRTGLVLTSAASAVVASGVRAACSGV